MVLVPVETTVFTLPKFRLCLLFSTSRVSVYVHNMWEATVVLFEHVGICFLLLVCVCVCVRENETEKEIRVW